MNELPVDEPPAPQARAPILVVCIECAAPQPLTQQFCSVCGVNLHSSLSPWAKAQKRALESRNATAASARGASRAYRVSLTRVLILSILSLGLYYSYWLYVTWRDYRDHTGATAYPVWHALTQLVPVYGLFRLHAHARTYKELMTKAGVPTTINPGWIVVAVVVVIALSLESLRLSTSTITGDTALFILALNVLSMLVIGSLLLHLQHNVNAYWTSRVEGSAAETRRVDLGEAVFTAVGLLIWAGTLANLLSPSYRAL